MNNNSIDLNVSLFSQGFEISQGTGASISISGVNVQFFGDSSNILNGQLLIGNSGDNSFEAGNIYGLSGISIISGSSTLGISFDSSSLSFYPLTGNPSGYAYQTGLNATGVYLYNIITGVSGSLNTVISNLQNWSGSTTGLYYPLNSNPLNYLTSLAGTGSLTGVFYPLNSNPSNYSSISQLNSTGNYLYSLISASSAGVGSLNGLSGLVNITGISGINVSNSGQLITLSYTGIISSGGGGSLIKYSSWIGDNSGLFFIVNHNLGSSDLIVETYDSGNYRVFTDFHNSGTNNTIFNFSTGLPVSGIRVVIIG